MLATDQVRRVYVLEAAPETVFGAWTDARQLMQWWCPGPARATAATLDVRVGGRYRIDMSAGPLGLPQIICGEYLEVAPPRLLVMTWRARNTPHDNGDDSLLTVRFEPHMRGTRLELLHERLPAGSSPSYGGGWDDVLNTLARTVQA